MKLLMEQWKKYLDEIESFDTITKSQDDIKKSLELEDLGVMLTVL